MHLCYNYICLYNIVTIYLLEKLMRFNTETSNNTVQNLESLTASLKDFETKKEAFNQMKKKLINEFRESLNSLAGDIFKTIPELKAISWIQFTPYFNDGDECVFSIREVIFYNFIPNRYFRYAEEFEDDEYPENYWAAGDYELGKNKTTLSEEKIKFLKKFETTINQNRDFVKEIFGDHSKVIWNADGIKIEDYSEHH